MHYKRLTREERYQIQALKRSGQGVRAVARTLSRSPSTISRELRRNNGRAGYWANFADESHRRRRRDVHPPRKISGRIEKTVRRRLFDLWSPEQISSTTGQVSTEAVYRYVYRSFSQGDPSLYLCLRRRHKRRWPRRVQRAMRQCGKRLSYPPFSKRPKIVDKRRRLGDWERDGLLGKRGGPLLLSYVDRVSRYLRLSKIPRLSAELAHQKTVELLVDLPVRTITNDNGPEFADYRKTEEALSVKIYFNDPYASWQRGTNENTNGLIRQYFPKGTDFSEVSEDEIKKVEAQINDRPRKCLGYKTPREVQAFKSQRVALRA